MRDTEDLMHSRKIPKLLSHRHADPTANALVDFVEDQRRYFVGAGEHILQAKHETRSFAARGNLCQRLESFAGIRGDQKFHFIEAILIKPKARSILRGRTV